MPDKQIIDLPALDELKDTDYLVVGRPSAPEPAQKMQGAQLVAFVDKSAQPHVTEAAKQAQAAAASAQTATTKASEASQSATQAQDAQQGAATAQDAAETARDQSVAAAGTIEDFVEQAQDAASQASSAKDAAVTAQTAAEAAKTAAETASGQAQTAATQAAGSATAAQTAAIQAGGAKTDAETARNEAETSASSAANSASDAESAATEAEQAKTYIENMDMEGETLPAGSSVTVTKTTSPEGNLLFVIGVPQGIQGDKGETGETGATGPQGVSVTNATVNEDGDLVITLSAGEPINAGSVIGPQGIQGDVGPTGASVDRIERTSGTGAPGTTDTYTVYLTDGQTGGTFQVYNGSNGTGSGDFMADGSVPMTGDLQMGGHAVTGMADGTEPTDGATVGQLAGKLDSPDGGTAGQVLTKTADGSSWEDAPSGLPDGGTEGQMLYKSADGAAWGDKPVMVVNVTEGGDGTTSNKTVAEIKEAYLNGLYIFANYLDSLLPLSSVTDVTTSEPLFEFMAYMPLTRTGGILTELSLGRVRIFRTDGKDYTNFYVHEGGLVPTDGNQGETLYCDDVGVSYWGPAPKGIPDGGTTGQVLTKTSTGEEWSDAPSGLPEGGTEGQILEKTSSGAAWVDKPESGLTQEQADERYLQLTGGTVTGEVDMGQNPIRNVSTIFGGTAFAIRSGGSTTVDAFMLNISTSDGTYISGGLTSSSIDATNITVSNVGSGDTAVPNKAYVDSKSPTSVAITLTTSGWSNNDQTVPVPGVSASETAQLITPTPAIASQFAYHEAGIMCTWQDANSLTFTCRTVPASNLTVYVVIQPLS